MDIEKAIKHTNEKQGMKVCITNVLRRVAKHKGQISGGYQFVIEEFAKHYEQARNSWVNNDLHTVAEFFGLYIVQGDKE